MELALPRRRVEREDVENQHGSVDDPYLVVGVIVRLFEDAVLHVADLHRGELVVEYHQSDVVFHAELAQFLQLAAADIGFGDGALKLLHNGGEESAARRVQEPVQLVQRDRLSGGILIGGDHRHQHGQGAFVFIK